MTTVRRPLFGEDYGFALLLRMVLHHCATMNQGELDSFAIEANTDTMLALAEAGFIEITQQADGRVFGTILPEGEALAAQFVAERDRDRR